METKRGEWIAKLIYAALIVWLLGQAWATMGGDWLERAAVLVLITPFVVFASFFLLPIVSAVSIVAWGVVEAVLLLIRRRAQSRSPV